MKRRKGKVGVFIGGGGDNRILLRKGQVKGQLMLRMSEKDMLKSSIL